jgi:hypothetical protein
MKTFSALILLGCLSLGGAMQASAQLSNSGMKHSRASQKAEKKQMKAQKKYAKAQRKAQKKMLKQSRKGTSYPKHTI